jgi:hypothetical protein
MLFFIRYLMIDLLDEAVVTKESSTGAKRKSGEKNNRDEPHFRKSERKLRLGGCQVATTTFGLMAFGIKMNNCDDGHNNT